MVAVADGRRESGVAASVRVLLEPDALVLALGGAVGRGEIPAICACLREALERTPREIVLCDLAALVRADVAVVEALVRLQFIARQSGGALRVRHAPAALSELLALLGLSEVVELEPASAVEPQRQSEEREQRRGVEEEADPGDLPG